MGVVVNGMNLALSMFLGVMAIALGTSLVFYLLESFGIYRMSQTLGIRSAWFSFIPVLQCYQLGKIAEALPDGKCRRISVILLITNLLSVLLGVILAVVYVAMVIHMIEFGFGVWNGFGYDFPEEYFYSLLANWMVPLMMGMLVLSALSIAFTVFYFIALWRVYKLFSPESAIVFLVLSILFNVCGPILLFVLRKNSPVSEQRTWGGDPQYPQV